MADSAAAVFAWFEFIGNHFRAFRFADNDSMHSALGNVGQTDSRTFPIMNEEDFIEYHSLIGIEQLDVEDVSFFNAVLFAADFDDRVHSASKKSKLVTEIILQKLRVVNY
jgi:hypothetical protein